MDKAIWRSRAITILGFLILLFSLLPGLPSAFKDWLFAVLGLAIAIFGFVGSRKRSYEKPVVIVEETAVEEVITPNDQEN